MCFHCTFAAQHAVHFVLHFALHFKRRQWILYYISKDCFTLCFWNDSAQCTGLCIAVHFILQYTLTKWLCTLNRIWNDCFTLCIWNDSALLCTWNDCTGDTRSSSVFQCAAPLLFGRPSFLATIWPENDQIHGSGQRKQNKQSEAKLGHMTIDLHAGGRQLHKDRRQMWSFTIHSWANCDVSVSRNLGLDLKKYSIGLKKSWSQEILVSRNLGIKKSQYLGPRTSQSKTFPFEFWSQVQCYI